MVIEPQMHADERRSAINEIASRIIGAAFTVSNQLGAGFLEKVYENALTHEIRKSGLSALQQWPIDVWYDGIIVGQYITDILVEDTIVVEAKAIKALDDIHLAQCLN